MPIPDNPGREVDKAKLRAEAQEWRRQWIRTYHSGYGSSSSRFPTPRKKTDLDVLIEHHQFIRDSDEHGSSSNRSWEDQVALKYYDSLFREFAMIDLKHYKTGGVALRWRTSEEVIARKGELTCASLRCEYHEPDPELVKQAEEEEEGKDEDEDHYREKRSNRRGSDREGRRRTSTSPRAGSSRDNRGERRKRDAAFDHNASFVSLDDDDDDVGEESHDTHSRRRRRSRSRSRSRSPKRSDPFKPLVRTRLTPFQLNFAYVERGANKEALVKVVLCERCGKKLGYKKRKEKEQERDRGRESEKDRHASRSTGDLDEVRSESRDRSKQKRREQSRHLR